MTNESTEHDPSPVSPRVAAEREQEIDEIVREVAELPDRTSPDDWPEAMLVTADELRSILTAVLHADAARPRAADRSEPIEPAQSDRAEPIRKDLARLLDNLYGLHARPGHVDAVLQVFQVHAPVKIPVAEAASPRAPQPAFGSEVLCEDCAKVFCPHGEQLHFHHDGCPACAAEAASPRAEGLKA